MYRPSLALALLLATPALADISPEANVCIDELRARYGNIGGEVIAEEWGEAGTLVHLRDGNGVDWDCLVWSGPVVRDLRRAEPPDDGGGAMAGAAAMGDSVSGTRRVQFAPGTSGIQMTATLAPASSVRYVLGARDGQFLRVDIAALGGALDYRITNPDGTALLDLISSDTPYEGQLWQSGDHTVEVVNTGAQAASFDIGIGIE